MSESELEEHIELEKQNSAGDDNDTYSDNFEETKDVISGSMKSNQSFKGSMKSDDVYSEDEGFEDDVDNKESSVRSSAYDGLEVSGLETEKPIKLPSSSAGQSKSKMVTINDENDKKLQDAISLSKGLSVNEIIPKKKIKKTSSKSSSKDIVDEGETDLSGIEIHKGQQNMIKKHSSKEERKSTSPLKNKQADFDLKNKQNQEKYIENEKKVDLMLQNHQLNKGERTDNVDEQEKHITRTKELSEISQSHTSSSAKIKKIKKKVHRSSSTGNNVFEPDPPPHPQESQQMFLMKQRERALLEAIEDLSAQLTISLKNELTLEKRVLELTKAEMYSDVDDIYHRHQDHSDTDERIERGIKGVYHRDKSRRIIDTSPRKGLVVGKSQRKSASSRRLEEALLKGNSNDLSSPYYGWKKR
mmetsp:Transcript_15927/g.15289  ORF Transcript_15927/g.15289 Transcript_15927/m.15289 type:complete len:415 (+) Transcript_15927:184-1428(+)